MSAVEPLIHAWVDATYNAELASEVVKHWDYGVPMHPQAGPEVVAAIEAGTERKTRSLLSELARVSAREDTQLVLAKKNKIYLWQALLGNESLTAGAFEYLVGRLKKYSEGPRQRSLPRDSEVDVLKASLRTGVPLDWMSDNLLARCLDLGWRDEDLERLIVGAPQSACKPFGRFLERESMYIRRGPFSKALMLAVQSLDDEEAQQWLKKWNSPRTRLIIGARQTAAGTMSYEELWAEIREFLQRPDDTNMGGNPRIHPLSFLAVMLGGNGLAEVVHWQSGTALWHPKLREAMAATFEKAAADNKPIPVLEAQAYYLNKITLEKVEVGQAGARGVLPTTQMARAPWIDDEELMLAVKARGRCLDEPDVNRFIEHRGWAVEDVIEYITPSGLLKLDPEKEVSSRVLIDILRPTESTRYRHGISPADHHLNWLNRNGGSSAVGGDALRKLVLGAEMKALKTASGHRATRKMTSQLIEEVCGENASAWGMLFSLGATWEGSLGDLLEAVRAVSS